MRSASASSVSASAVDDPNALIIIPSITSLSVSTITAGINTPITVTGTGFTNLYQSVLLGSKVVLTAPDDFSLILEPIVITESLMEVDIPDTLVLGNYVLRAAKEDKTSNPIVITVIPVVEIDSANCINGIVTINGSGFSQHVDAVESGTSVQLAGGSTCTVNSWSDTEIKANCGTCSGTVEVDSVFGTASKTVVDLNKPPVANAGSDKRVKRNISVNFDGSASIDPDGTITMYVWTFGDNSSASGKIVSHKFTEKGTYTVTLTVTDNKGATAADTAKVTVK